MAIRTHGEGSRRVEPVDKKNIVCDADAERNQIAGSISNHPTACVLAGQHHGRSRELRAWVASRKKHSFKLGNRLPALSSSHTALPIVTSLPNSCEQRRSAWSGLERILLPESIQWMFNGWLYGPAYGIPIAAVVSPLALIENRGIQFLIAEKLFWKSL